MNKVFIVFNCDNTVFGVFSSEEKASFVAEKMKEDYPDDGFYVEEQQLDTIELWILSKKLDDLGIKVISN